MVNKQLVLYAEARRQVELLAFILLNIYMISMNINKLGGHTIILLERDRICVKDILMGAFYFYLTPELDSFEHLNYVYCCEYPIHTGSILLTEMHYRNDSHTHASSVHIIASFSSFADLYEMVKW